MYEFAQATHETISYPGGGGQVQSHVHAGTDANVLDSLSSEDLLTFGSAEPRVEIPLRHPLLALADQNIPPENRSTIEGAVLSRCGLDHHRLDVSNVQIPPCRSIQEEEDAQPIRKKQTLLVRHLGRERRLVTEYVPGQNSNR